MVSWIYHVAPIIRLGDGKLYILDPSLSADPIPKEVWYEKMTAYPGARITGYVTCDANTYHPGRRCFNPNRVNDETLQMELQEFLEK